jgi:hypothetical protein
MNYDDVLKHLSPCGLDCTRCVDYRDGRIKELSLTLRELLGDYDRVARPTCVGFSGRALNRSG